MSEAVSDMTVRTIYDPKDKIQEKIAKNGVNRLQQCGEERSTYSKEPGSTYPRNPSSREYHGHVRRTRTQGTPHKEKQ